MWQGSMIPEQVVMIARTHATMTVVQDEIIWTVPKWVDSLMNKVIEAQKRKRNSDYNSIIT